MLYYFPFDNKRNKKEFLEILENYFSENIEVRFINLLSYSNSLLESTPFFSFEYLKYLKLDEKVFSNCIIQIKGQLKENILNEQNEDFFEKYFAQIFLHPYSEKLFLPFFVNKDFCPKNGIYRDINTYNIENTILKLIKKGKDLLENIKIYKRGEKYDNEKFLEEKCGEEYDEFYKEIKAFKTKVKKEIKNIKKFKNTLSQDNLKNVYVEKFFKNMDNIEKSLHTKYDFLKEFELILPQNMLDIASFKTKITSKLQEKLSITSSLRQENIFEYIPNFLKISCILSKSIETLKENNLEELKKSYSDVFKLEQYINYKEKIKEIDNINTLLLYLKIKFFGLSIYEKIIEYCIQNNLKAPNLKISKKKKENKIFSEYSKILTEYTECIIIFNKQLYNMKKLKDDEIKYCENLLKNFLFSNIKRVNLYYRVKLINEINKVYNDDFKDFLSKHFKTEDNSDTEYKIENTISYFNKITRGAETNIISESNLKLIKQYFQKKKEDPSFSNILKYYALYNIFNYGTLFDILTEEEIIDTLAKNTLDYYAEIGNSNSFLIKPSLFCKKYKNADTPFFNPFLSKEKNAYDLNINEKYLFKNDVFKLVEYIGEGEEDLFFKYYNTNDILKIKIKKEEEEKKEEEKEEEIPIYNIEKIIPIY